MGRLVLRSVRTWAALFIAVMGAVIAAAVGALAYGVSAAQTEEAFRRETDLLLASEVRNIADRIDLTKRVLTDLAARVGRAGPEGASAILREFGKAAADLIPGTDRLEAALETGYRYVDSGGSAPASLEVRNLPWYARARNRTGEPGVTHPYFDYRDQSIDIAVFTALRDGEDRFLGAAAVIFDTARLGPLLASEVVGERGILLLVDADGCVIASRDGRGIGRCVPEFEAALAAELPRLDFSLDGERFDTALAPVPGTGLYAAAGASRDEACEGLRRTFAVLFGSGLSIALVFCVLAYAAARRAILPLLRLAEHMKEAENGDYRPTASFDEYSEVRDLARGFNDMVEAVRVRDEMLRNREKRIRDLAYSDPLTGLANRARLLKTLNGVLSGKEGRGLSGALFYLDLDRFKIVNDTQGHSVGDRVLQEVARKIEGEIRRDQLAARIGGDEFVVLLPGIDSPETAGKIARRFLDVLNRPLTVDGTRFDVGASLGVVLYPVHGSDSETLLKNADLAMYRAKRSGKGRYQVFEENLQSEILYRLSIENEIRDALARGEFVFHYQAQREARTGRIAGFEALLRSVRPGLAGLPVSDVIQVAEESGLIAQVERALLPAACRFAEMAGRAAGTVLPVSVNISPVHLAASGFTKTVLQCLERYGLPATAIQLEITESVIMDPRGAHVRILHELSDAGVACHLDDFGTGYSSLGRLQDLPIRNLKIDRSIVESLDRDDRKAAIATFVSQLARRLGMTVVMEGIETQSQLDKAVECGCDIVQGFVWDRPLPEDEALVLLARETAQGGTNLVPARRP